MMDEYCHGPVGMLFGAVFFILTLLWFLDQWLGVSLIMGTVDKWLALILFWLALGGVVYHFSGHMK